MSGKAFGGLNFAHHRWRRLDCPARLHKATQILKTIRGEGVGSRTLIGVGSSVEALECGAAFMRVEAVIFECN